MHNQTQVVEKRRHHRSRLVAVWFCALLPWVVGADGTSGQGNPKAASPPGAVAPGQGTNGLNRLSASETAVTDHHPATFLSGTNSPLHAISGAKVASPADDSMRRLRQGMTSSNMVSNAGLMEDPLNETKAREQQLQHQFELGLQLRKQQEYELAAKTFLAVVEAKETPTELRRSALLELAMTAQERQHYSKAQQILTQYVRQFPEDSAVPEILLRQGQLYRLMGANTLALAKFYAVMTVVLHLKLDHFDFYRRLVLQAQTEIAETYYLAGKYADAADFFGRLLKADSKELNQSEILYKLIRCQRMLAHHEEVIATARQFMRLYPHDSRLAEVRFEVSESYCQRGLRAEAMQEVQQLLVEQQAAARENPESWLYWRLRAGNMLANQFYSDGDYYNALELYLNLAQLTNAAEWQLPTLYQTALVYEKLRQPEKAVEIYKRIASREAELGASPKLSLKAIVDMARWRVSHLDWRIKGEQVLQSLQPAMQPQSLIVQ
jgi:TolA-binding protein